MSKYNKIFACIQTCVILFLMACSGGNIITNAKKSGAFPCEEHQCGCKSEADCKTHCCCAPDENQNKFRNNSENQNGFKTFISSINCKYGNDPLTISFTAKYMLENRDTLTEESFLSFLSNDLTIRLPEVVVAPPEKPPRHYL